jgi:mRNA-degrading endonuclease toxin of MazEF toxin-antitoxin module
MDYLKINNMSEQDLLSYINTEINNIQCNIRNYDNYYASKISTYQAIIQNHTTKPLTIDVLRKKAYEIKNISEYVEWSYRKQLMSDTAITRNNIKPKRGEIWTCDLGKNIGSEEYKLRPVIIVQNNTGNDLSPTTIIVPISKRPKKIAIHIEVKDTDYTIAKGEKEGVTGTILCEQIRVISKARLGRHIATLTPDFISRILDVKLKQSIDL